MIELGKIVRIENGKGVVQMDARGGCRHCGMNNYCHSTGTGKRELKLGLEGRDVAEGDFVEIETPARSVLTAAFLVFILPLLIAIGAYMGVYSLTKDNGYGLLAFFVLFVVSMILVSFIDRVFGRGRFFEPRIVRRVEPHSADG